MPTSHWQLTRIQDTSGKRSALWDITGTCNLRCKHCYQFDRYNYHEKGAYQNDLSFEEILKVLDRLTESNITHIHFLSGEPLLRPDFPTILTEVKARDIYVSINTNGTSLTNKKVSELAGLGVNQIMVSLDGASSETNDAIRGKGTFETVWRNICSAAELTRNTEMLIGIAFTATSSNSHEIPELLRLCLEAGIEYIHIVPVDDAGNFVYHKNTLGDDEIVLITHLEEGLRLYGSQLIGRMTIRTDLRLWPIEILNRKYGTILEPDPTGIKCQGGSKFLVIQADGRLGSCNAALDPKFSANVVSNGFLNSEPEYVQLLDPGSLDNSKTLQEFYRYKSAPDTFAHLTPCDQCRFYEQCQPCPIEHASDRTVRECKWAEKEEQRMRQEFLAGTLIPALPFVLEDDRLVDKESERFVELGQMLSIVLQEMEHRSVADALNDLPFSPTLTEEQKDEILQVLEQLHSLNALQLKPYERNEVHA